MDSQNLPKCDEFYRLLELEKLNTETAEINKLELELEEANTTFRMLLNEATRRLKGLAQRLGNSVDRARPYYESLTTAQDARAACQRAAVAYQRASEIHAAAKETVALAEQRFKSNQHEWQFDSAWQEMLNHATIKVMDAENQKAECGREHHKRAQFFNAAETKLQQLEEHLKKHVIKSRPYFDEKQLCQEQLATQKERINYLQNLISKAKFRYSQSLKTLEAISEEIHMKRRDLYDDNTSEYPVGPREPGVGAENYTDYSLELEMNDLSLRNKSMSDVNVDDDTDTLEELRRRVRRLAARPVDGGECGDIAWETELNETVNRLDQMLLMREKAQQVKAKEKISFSSNLYKPFNDGDSDINFEQEPSTSSTVTESKSQDYSEIERLSQEVKCPEKTPGKHVDEKESPTLSNSCDTINIDKKIDNSFQTICRVEESDQYVKCIESNSIQNDILGEAVLQNNVEIPNNDCLSINEIPILDNNTHINDNDKSATLAFNTILQNEDVSTNLDNKNSVTSREQNILSLEQDQHTVKSSQKIFDDNLTITTKSRNESENAVQSPVEKFKFGPLKYTIIFDDIENVLESDATQIGSDKKQSDSNIHMTNEAKLEAKLHINLDNKETKIFPSVLTDDEIASQSHGDGTSTATRYPAIVDDVNRGIILKIHNDDIEL